MSNPQELADYLAIGGTPITGQPYGVGNPAFIPASIAGKISQTDFDTYANLFAHSSGGTFDYLAGQITAERAVAAGQNVGGPGQPAVGTVFAVGTSGATTVGGVGASLGSGSSIPGGTAGALTSTQRGSGSASNLLAGLSHTTAGLNWSHLALWLAILAGAYIALDALTGKHKRRR